MTSAAVSPSFSRSGGIDDDAIARAEAALKSLASQLGEWLDEELARMEAAQAAFRQDPTSANADQLYLHAHDLKGLGTTYDFPLISRIAASLCQLFDGSLHRSEARGDLIDAHVEAIVTVVRQDIRDPLDSFGSRLADDLETRVREAGGALSR